MNYFFIPSKLKNPLKKKDPAFFILYNKKKKINIELIRIIVANYFDIKDKELDRKTRKRKILLPRQIAQYFAIRMTKYSQRYVGRKIGKKDHATVLHSCKTIQNLIDTNKQTRDQIAEIERRILY